MSCMTTDGHDGTKLDSRMVRHGRHLDSRVQDTTYGGEFAGKPFDPSESLRSGSLEGNSTAWVTARSAFRGMVGAGRYGVFAPGRDGAG
jgi:hypothetical protein